jgi:hypothetical protein
MTSRMLVALRVVLPNHFTTGLLICLALGTIMTGHPAPSCTGHDDRSSGSNVLERLALQYAADHMPPPASARHSIYDDNKTAA